MLFQEHSPHNEKDNYHLKLSNVSPVDQDLAPIKL